MTSLSSPKTLDQLPRSIWIPSPENTIFRGSPTQIIDEMSPPILRSRSLRRKVKHLLDNLAKKRALVIGLPTDVGEDVLAGLFVFALLDTGIAKPAWLA